MDLAEFAPRRRQLHMTGVVAAVVAIDQATKWWALSALDDRDVDLIWTLRLNLLMNKGSAFGLGSRYTPLITLLAMAIVLVILRTSSKLIRRWPQVAVALVIGGALGNLFDRVFRSGSGLLGGAVVDFIDFQWWPVFNVADIAISVGAVLLVLTGSSDERTT